ncbi:MAG TPA: enoyl-CoA hydratase-related protein [Acidimicrobiia bacterium]|nr:enoyl-CoA hydratase-related protein [Acidimicrobiia bacterium]
MSLVRYDVDGAVAVLTLDRPPLNALSLALVDDLAEAIEQASDPAVRAVVVTGAPHFAAGADIKEFEVVFEGGLEGSPAQALGSTFRALELLEKPVIAAVRGFALGGGLELALACDFRYLADDARVGQPEIKLGIIPGAGGTQRLSRIVGLGRARDIVYGGRQVAADEALAIGLADRVVPADDLLEASLESARAWAHGPTAAIGIAKRAINEGFGLPLDEALAVERGLFADVFRTADAREGVSAFLEKRDPDFRGR